MHNSEKYGKNFPFTEKSFKNLITGENAFPLMEKLDKTLKTTLDKRKKRYTDYTNLYVIMDPDIKEKIEKYAKNGWNFRKRIINDIEYILTYKGRKERSLGPFSQEKWNLLIELGAVRPNRSNDLLNSEIDALKTEIESIKTGISKFLI